MTAERVEAIRAALEERFKPSGLSVVDDSAAHAGHAGAREGGHFRVTVVSEAFRGHSRIERHRLVYEALEPLMGTQIHAVNIRAITPDESIDVLPITN